MAGEHRPPAHTLLPIPLTKDHHCCKKTAHGRRSRFLHKLLRGNDGNSEVGEPKCDCPVCKRGRHIAGPESQSVAKVLRRAYLPASKPSNAACVSPLTGVLLAAALS